MERNNGRLRRMLTQFLNKKNRDNDNASMEYLNNQMQMVEEQIKSVNDDMMNISNLYYQALSEGNIEQASMLQNQLKDMKERKKRYKQQKKQIEDNIDEIKDLQDIVEEQSEETRNAFGDAFDDMTDILQTLNIMDIKDKIGESVDNINDAIREASNTLGLDDTEKKALTDAIYENTNAINDAAGKNIMSVNDAADDIAALIDAGMTNQETLGQLAPILAEGNKLLGLESDEIADLAVKFQDNPDVVKNLYNMMANGKVNLPDEYKDYAIKGYEEYAEQSNDMAQALYNYQEKGLDVNDINAQLLAINSTLQKNSLGDMDLSQMIQDANSMNTSEFVEAYGNQGALIQSRLQQGDMTALEDYINAALVSIQNGTPQEQWQTMYGDVLDYQDLKNSGATTDQIATDFQTYLDTYRGGINNEEVMNQLAQSHSMSPLEEFWNYFSGLPLIQKISTTLGDLDLSVSDIVAVGYGITGLLKNFPGLLKVITKPLNWITGLFGGAEGGSGILATIGGKISSLFGGGTAAATGAEAVAGGSGLLATLGKVAPWLSVGTAGIETVSGLYQGITSDNQKDKARGYTKAGLTGGATAIGALLGSVIPGAGTLVGAGVGAAVGSIGDWLFGDKISSWFGGDEESNKESNTTTENTTQSTENNATINNADDSTIGVLNSIYSTITEWFNSYQNNGITKTSTNNPESLSVENASYTTNKNLINTSENADTDYTKLINDANTMSTTDFITTYGNQAALIQERLKQGDMSAIQDLEQSAKTSIDNGTPQEQWETMYGNTFDYNSLKSSSINSTQVGVNNDPTRLMENSMEQVSETNYSSQNFLANINSILFDWYNLYKYGERTKAQTLSNYTAFNQGATLTTADMSSSAYSSAPNAATPENIESGQILENYQENTGIETGDNLDSGSTIAPGFEGSHKNGLDYVPHDGYIAELHKGEAVLTSNENLIWKAFKENQNINQSYNSHKNNQNINQANNSISSYKVESILSSLHKGDSVVTSSDNKNYQNMSQENNSDKNYQNMNQVESILSSYKIDGSHKNGLDYVPYDGYIAELHKGEAVLTADENKNYQNINQLDNSLSISDKTGNILSEFHKVGSSITFSDNKNYQDMNQVESILYDKNYQSANQNTDLSTSYKVDGSHKKGLKNVPKDGYIAELHKGEGVLTSKENKKYRESNKDVPMARATTVNNNSVSAATTGQFPTYALSQSQINGIARICAKEQPVNDAAQKAEASLIGNLTDFRGNDRATVDRLIKTATGAWFSTRGQYYANWTPSATSINAVRSTLVEGKRTLPRYVDNHDYFGDIAWVKNNGQTFNKRDRSQYKKDVTRIYSNFKAMGTFYGFPSEGSDPFYYNDGEGAKYKSKWGDFHYNASGGSTVGSPGSGDVPTTQQAPAINLPRRQFEKITKDSVKKTEYKKTNFASLPIENAREENFINSMFLMDMLTSPKLLEQAAMSMTDFDNAVKAGQTPNVAVSPTTGTTPSTGNTTDPNLNLDSNNVAQSVWTALTSQGFSKEAAAGVMGNFQAESEMNPKCIQGNGKGPAAGIAQWENYNTKSQRWKQMADYAKSKGKDWTDLGSQVSFVIMELGGAPGTDSYTSSVLKRNVGGLDKFKQLNNVDTATVEFEKAFERAGVKAYEKRKKYAHSYYDKFNAYEQGTPWVPNDQVALIHKGEMVIPKQNNPLANGTKISTSNITNNTNTTTSEKDTVRELKQLASILQQGIQYLGKKLDKKDTNNSNTQQTPTNNRAKSLYNLRDIYAKNQL